MSETFSHGFQEYGGRDVYSPELAVAANGPATALTELIDELLITNTQTATSTGVISSNAEAYSLTRQFSYMDTPEGSPLGTMAETTIDIGYEANRKLGQHHYNVAISWMVASLLRRKMTQPLVPVRYSIVSYNNGPTYGYVYAPDMLIYRKPKQAYEIKERPLTAYDCVDLANELAAIHELDDSPWQDNKVL